MISDLVDQMAKIGKFEPIEVKKTTWYQNIGFSYTNIIYTISFAVVFLIIIVGAILLYCKFYGVYLHLSETSSSNNQTNDHEMANMQTQDSDAQGQNSASSTTNLTNAQGSSQETSVEVESGGRRLIPFNAEPQPQSQTTAVTTKGEVVQANVNENKKTFYKKFTTGIRNYNVSKAVFQTPPLETVAPKPKNNTDSKAVLQTSPSETVAPKLKNYTDSAAVLQIPPSETVAPKPPVETPSNAEASTSSNA